MAEAILTKRDGEWSMDKSLDYLCSTLRNGTYSVKITRKTEPRTVNQNALMWMWYTCIEEATGTPKADIHDYYKAKFLQRMVGVGNRWVTVVGSTTDLNTLQMTDFLNKVQADAATKFGITLPLPADRHYQEFIDDYKKR